MKRLSFLAPLALALLLPACNLLPSGQQADIVKFVTGLENKITTDLTTAKAVADVQVTDNLGTHAVDQPGSDCAAALIQVQADVKAILDAANVKGAGALTAAEVGSILLPGTPTTNNARDAIVKGCSVKVAQVTQAVAGGAAWFTQLAALFAIQLAPAGL